MTAELTDLLKEQLWKSERSFHGQAATIWKAALTVLSVVFFMHHAEYAIGEGTPWWTHFTYILCHANVFHLLGNLLCLLRMKPRLHMPESLLIAYAVTWLPMMTGGALTMGMSGVLFAAYGIKWGQVHRAWGMLKYCGSVVLITALIPGMNWAIHCYALITGFAYGWLLGYIHKDLKR